MPLVRVRAVSRVFANGVQALGDGAVVVERGDSAEWQVVDLATQAMSPLPDSVSAAPPALDAAGRVLYATDTDLVVHDLGFGGTSKPRA